MITTDALLTRLDGVKQTGTYKWSAHCPCSANHKNADADSSLSIEFKPESGKILMYCHTGCDIEEICAELKINKRDLSPDPVEVDKRRDFLIWYASQPSQKGLTLQAVYSYDYGEYSDGLAKVRFRKADGRKDFRWIRNDPNSKSGFKMTHEGCPHRLYFAGAPTASTVCVVEGEKDADRLHRLSGYTVACTENGASRSLGKWLPEYNKQLEGKTVYIMGDNDDIGRAWIMIQANKLAGCAAHVYTIDLTEGWSEAPEKADISDMADALGDDDAKRILADLMQNATEFTPSGADAGEDPQSFGDKPVFVDLDAIPDEDDTKYIWFPYIPMNEVTILAAPGGTGKGMLFTLLAARLSSGQGLTDAEPEPCPERQRGLEPGEKAVTLILSKEDGARRIKPRFLISNGVPAYLKIVDDTLYDSNEKEFLLRFNIGTDEGCFELERWIKASCAKLVVVDPITSFMTGKRLNNGDDTRMVLHNLTRLARRTNTAIIAVTHTRKGSKDDAAMTDLIAGSHEIKDVARSVLMIGYDIEDERTIDEFDYKTPRRLVYHLKTNHSTAGKTVRYYIKENEDKQAGGQFPTSELFPTFSDVTAELLERTPHGTLPALYWQKLKAEREARRKNSENSIPPRVWTALSELMQTMESNGQTEVSISYRQFEEDNGGNLWSGSHKQSHDLSRCLGLIKRNGYYIETGKSIGGKEKGFKLLKFLESTD